MNDLTRCLAAFAFSAPLVFSGLAFAESHSDGEMKDSGSESSSSEQENSSESAENNADDEKSGESESADSGSSDGAAGKYEAAYEEGGKWFTEDDTPTFNVKDDGTVDWYTYSGFRRYNAECHVCHGPDGEGGSYAPALKNSAVEMDYYDFYAVVVNGKKNVGASANSVMPSFGDNENVMCYLDDIYVYLLARGLDEVGRGRPPKKERPSEEFRENEDACMGS